MNEQINKETSIFVGLHCSYNQSHDSALEIFKSKHSQSTNKIIVFHSMIVTNVCFTLRVAGIWRTEKSFCTWFTLMLLFSRCKCPRQTRDGIGGVKRTIRTSWTRTSHWKVIPTWSRCVWSLFYWKDGKNIQWMNNEKKRSFLVLRSKSIS